MKEIKIKGIGHSYPEAVEGSAEWLCCYEGEVSCDVYEAEEIYKQSGAYAGSTSHVLHVPDGEVHSPFPMQKNRYVQPPICSEGKLYFLSTDFQNKEIQIAAYIPELQKLEIIAALSLEDIKDCYNLRLDFYPLTLSRFGDNVYEVLWPERCTISLGERETVYFRDEEVLYCSEWSEDPLYREFVLVRKFPTGEILKKEEGYIRKITDRVFWTV